MNGTMTTGNGFPAACYTIFKVMWYRNHEPEMFNKVYKILGTKDYINYKLTGVFKTDYSYASGTGIYDLKGWRYAQNSSKPAASLQKYGLKLSHPHKFLVRLIQKLPTLWD